jgi:hypothetical protein
VNIGQPLSAAFSQVTINAGSNTSFGIKEVATSTTTTGTLGGGNLRGGAVGAAVTNLRNTVINLAAGGGVLNQAIGIDSTDGYVNFGANGTSNANQGANSSLLSDTINNGQTGVRLNRQTGSTPANANLLSTDRIVNDNNGGFGAWGGNNAATFSPVSAFIGQIGNYIELGTVPVAGLTVNAGNLIDMSSFRWEGTGSANAIQDPTASAANVLQGYNVENKIVDAVDAGFTDRGYVRLRRNTMYATQSSFTNLASTATLAPNVQRDLDVLSTVANASGTASQVTGNSIYIQGGTAASNVAYVNSATLSVTQSGTQLVGTQNNGTLNDASAGTGTNPALRTAATEPILAGPMAVQLIAPPNPPGGPPVPTFAPLAAPLMTVSADGVGVRGLRLINQATNASGVLQGTVGAATDGIRITGNRTSSTIRRNSILDFTQTYINYTGTSDNYNIVENDITNSNNTGTIGINVPFLSTTTSGNIDGNRIQGHAGASSSQTDTSGSGIVFGGANPNTSVTQNDFIGNRNGIFIGTTGADLTNTIVRGNSFSAPSPAVNPPTGFAVNNRNTNEVLYAPANWWGTNDPVQVAGRVNQAFASDVDFSPTLDVGTDAVGNGTRFQGVVDQNVLSQLDVIPVAGGVVNTPLRPNPTPTNPIQDAYNLLPAAGGTLRIMPGLYEGRNSLGAFVAADVNTTGRTIPTTFDIGTALDTLTPGTAATIGNGTFSNNVTFKLEVNARAGDPTDLYTFSGAVSFDSAKIAGNISASPPATAPGGLAPTTPLTFMSGSSATISTTPPVSGSFTYRGANPTILLAASVQGGTNIVLAASPSIVYVSPTFTGNPGDTVNLPSAVGGVTQAIVGVNAFTTIEGGLGVVSSAFGNPTVDVFGGTYTPVGSLVLNQANETLAQVGTTAVVINSPAAAATAVSLTGAGASVTGNSLLTINGTNTTGRTGVGVAVGAGNTAAVTGTAVNGFIGGNSIGISVSSGATRLTTDTLNNNLIDIQVVGGTSQALIQGTSITNPNDANNQTAQNIGLNVAANASVDAGGGANTTLGSSTGGNTFQGFAGNLPGNNGSLAINNNNLGGQVPTNNTMPLVVYARGNSFRDTTGTALPTYSDIEQRVIHFLDSGGTFSYVDYRGATGGTADPSVISSSLIFSGSGSGPITNPVPGQRSMIRGIQFQIDAPVFGLTADTVNIQRTGATSYGWYTGALPTGRVTQSLYTNASFATAAPDPVTGRTTVTVFFNNSPAFTAGAFTEFGSLVDGRYTLGLTTSSMNLLFNGSGTNAVSAATTGFFRMYGDMNGDATVTGVDGPFLTDAINNPSSLYRAFLDFNNDGVVNNAIEGTQFINRFFQSV